jgi:hypothetical protein
VISSGSVRPNLRVTIHPVVSVLNIPRFFGGIQLLRGHDSCVHLTASAPLDDRLGASKLRTKMSRL